MTSRQQPASDDEQAFLTTYDPGDFPPVAVAVDLVVLTVRDGDLCVLLVRRGAPPQRGRWALPGGFIRPHETLDQAARRELVEETGLQADSHLEQLASYGDPGRDPRMRVVSVAYLAMIPDLPQPTAGTDASDARYRPVTCLDHDGEPALAFDHDRILADAVERVRAKLEYTGLATAFLDEPFTIADLRRIYEAIWGVPLHPANFRRKVLSTPGYLVPTHEKLATGRGWAELYTRGATTQLHPPILRPR
jgi:8-oxo-dGTP diphosphatase